MRVRHVCFRGGATTAAILVLLAGLCISVSGSVTAQAEEPAPAPFAGFVQGGAADVTVADWFGAAATAAPVSAPVADGFALDPDDGADERPVVTTDIRLENCASAPKLTITYTFTDRDGIQEFYVSGTVGVEWVSYSPQIKAGEPVVEFTRTFDLTKMRDQNPSASVWLMADVSDTTWSGNSNIVELKVDFDHCSYVDLAKAVGDDQPPTVIVYEPVLSACDATPILEVRYSIADDSGILDIDLWGAITRNVDIDFAIGDTQVDFTERLPIDEKTMESAIDDVIVLGLDATDAANNKGSNDYQIKVDFEACTFEVIDTVGDGSGPSIVADSLSVRACDTNSPKLVVTYTVTDPDGLRFVAGVSDFYTTEMNLQEGLTTFSTTEIVDINDELYGGPPVDFTLVAADTFGDETYEDFALTINFETCSYTENDGKAPDIVVTALDLSQCDSRPQVSISYSVRDSDGLVEVKSSAGVGDATVDELVDFVPGSKQVTFSRVVTLDERIEGDGVQRVTLYAYATDVSSRTGVSQWWVYVDRTDCTYWTQNLLGEDDRY